MGWTEPPAREGVDGVPGVGWTEPQAGGGLSPGCGVDGAPGVGWTEPQVGVGWVDRALGVGQSLPRPCLSCITLGLKQPVPLEGR